MADLINQPETLIDALSAPALDPLFWRSDRSDVESAWYGHVPFAHWIVHALAPRCIVELGSHNGVSYAAFCRAAQREGLGTRCFAVDAWVGDEQGGFYGDEVLAGLRAYHNERFGAFSTLIHRTFDDALEILPEGSIDLLHIDGKHGYEDVRHDFQSWRDRMSDRGVVLFHDTNVRDNGFEVWRLWSELQHEFPSFEFLHAHGLGVLAVGAECPPLVAALAELHDPRAIGTIRERFAQLGERCVLEAQVKLLEKRSSQQIRQHDAVLIELRAAETALSMARSDLETVRLASVAAEATARTDRARLEALAHEQARALVGTSGHARNMEARRRAEAEAALERILRSSFWRMTKPFRTGLSRLPPGLHRPVHGTVRAIWRLMTPQLDVLRHNLDWSASATAPAPPAAVLTPLVYYVSGEPGTPGAIYRVKRYAAACDAIGAHATILRSDELAAHMDDVDRINVLVIWRAVWTDALAAFVSAARANGARIVFDVDDLVIDPALATTEIIDGIRSQNFSETQVQAHYAQLQRTMLEADYCSASTVELAGHMRRFAKTAFTLPNGFDVQTLHSSRIAARRRLAAQPDGFLRLGYATGSLTHQRDFAQIAPILPSVLRAHPQCRLVLFRRNNIPLIDLGEFPELKLFCNQIEWRDLVPLDRLPEEIARFDVNLVPLQLDNPFCEAKSELKYFEAALVGVCTVASPAGPYDRAIQHGTNGFLAATPAQWEATLTRLLSNPGLRRQVAQTALNDVLWTYGPDRRAQLMRRLLTEWQGGAAGADAFVLELNLRSGKTRTRPNTPLNEVVFSVDHLQMAEVTVAVPLCNYAHTVIETLESVRKQTLQTLDLIIVDDGSTDQSLKAAVAWARANAGRFNRLVVLRHPVNAGLGLTRNTAFSAAETAYILPLDADNLLRPSCCERLLAAIHGTDAAFVYPVIQEFGVRTGVIGNAPYHPSRFAGGNYIDAMALIAKSAWSAAGGYSQMRLGWEDYDFWCSLAEAGLHGLPMGGPPLAYYRVHETSMLAQLTDTQDVKRQVISSMEQRHPWVAVASAIEVPAAALPLVRNPTGQATGDLARSEEAPASGSGKWCIAGQ